MNPTTTADGSTTTGMPGTGVGAAVAIGVTNANSVASLGGTASVTAPTIGVNGLIPSSTFTVGATSGASGTRLGVAGSLAINKTSADANALVSDPTLSGTNLTQIANST